MEVHWTWMFGDKRRGDAWTGHHDHHEDTTPNHESSWLKRSEFDDGLSAVGANADHPGGDANGLLDQVDVSPSTDREI